METIKKKKTHRMVPFVTLDVTRDGVHRLASRATMLYYQDTSLYRPTHANCHGKLIRLLYPLA